MDTPKKPAGAGLIEEALTKSVIGAFYAVYSKLGHGFLESVYAVALEKELIKRGHRVRREVGVAVYYDGVQIGWHRLDMIVDEKLVVENKSSEDLPRTARRQLLSYLRATRLEVGLLFHYGPEAKFYRQISTNHDSPRQTDPRPPDNASS